MLAALVLAAPAAHAEVGVSGAAAPTADLPGWNLLLSDELKTLYNWGVYHQPDRGLPRGPTLASHTRLVDTGSGKYASLLTAPADTWLGWASAGMAFTKGTAKSVAVRQYGKWSMRMRMTRRDGTRSAVMLWPASGIWPPEIDVFETFRGWGEGEKTTIWWRDASGAPRHMDHGNVLDISRWHTYSVEWTASSLVFRIDGVEEFRTTEHVPAQRMWFGLNTAFGSNYASSPPPFGRFALQIDWAAVYAPAQTGTVQRSH